MKKDKNTYILNGLTLALLLLWIPLAQDKILHFDVFKAGILKQPFSNSLGWILIYSLPVLELVLVFLFVLPHFNLKCVTLSKIMSRSKKKDRSFRRTQRKYFYFFNPYLLSSLLMLTFTIYIGVALAGAWEKLPCGCGSAISGMSWTQHFWFNLFFLSISLWGFYLSKNKTALRHSKCSKESIHKLKINVS